MPPIRCIEITAAIVYRHLWRGSPADVDKGGRALKNPKPEMGDGMWPDTQLNAKSKRDPVRNRSAAKNKGLPSADEVCFVGVKS